MLNRSNITPVIPVNDINACKKFYTEKLGLTNRSTLPSGEVVLSGESGSEIMLRPIEGVRPSGYTEMSFAVTNIEKEIEELEKKGVKFEDYDDPEYKTDEHHVFAKENMKSAWFKDPSGNVLCLHQRKSGGVN